MQRPKRTFRRKKKKLVNKAFFFQKFFLNIKVIFSNIISNKLYDNAYFASLRERSLNNFQHSKEFFFPILINYNDISKQENTFLILSKKLKRVQTYSKMWTHLKTYGIIIKLNMFTPPIILAVTIFSGAPYTIPPNAAKTP